MPTPNWTRAIIAIFAGVMFFIATVTGDSIDQNGFRWLSGAMTGVVMLLLVYERWAWRWPVVRKGAEWAGRPVIHGTWKGELTFERDANNQPGSIVYYLSVDQSFSGVRIRAFVSTSESYSMTATIVRPMPNKRQLVFAYHSEAPHMARDGNRPHDGTAILSIVGIPAEELTGSYYNDRHRSGTIKLTQHTSKLTESFGHAERQSYKEPKSSK